MCGRHSVTHSAIWFKFLTRCCKARNHPNIIAQFWWKTLFWNFLLVVSTHTWRPRFSLYWEACIEGKEDLNFDKDFHFVFPAMKTIGWQNWFMGQQSNKFFRMKKVRKKLNTQAKKHFYVFCFYEAESELSSSTKRDFICNEVIL